MYFYLLFLSMTLVCVLRLFVPGHELSWPGTYEALAHIWVGYMICLIAHIQELQKPAFIALVFATTLEVIMFFLR